MRVALFGAALAAVVATGSAYADPATFDFSPVTNGTGTSFSLTSSGVTATFTGSGDPAGFQVQPSFFSGYIGSILYTPLGGVANQTLTISFSQDVDNVSMFFARDSATATGGLDLTALLNGVPVGVDSFTGAFGVDAFPEGTLSFGGTSFDSIELTDSLAPYFAIGNVTVDTVTAVPTPATLPLLLSGLIGLAWFRRRKAA